MTATQTNTDDSEKSTVPDHVARHADSLRVEADRLGEQLHDLADAREASQHIQAVREGQTDE